MQKKLDVFVSLWSLEDLGFLESIGNFPFTDQFCLRLQVLLGHRSSLSRNAETSLDTGQLSLRCLWDNLAKDVQSHYIRGPCLKQHNLHSKTYANNSKKHIHDRNTCPEHKNVNLMV